MKRIPFLALAMAFLLLGVAETVFGHEHKPPHGGTLVVFGDEFAHLELVLDAKSGKLSAYVLDGEAEKAVRIQQKELELKLSGEAGARIKLKAVGSALTGEKEGDTSQFEGQDAALKGATKFDAVVVVITVKGTEFKEVKFNFPLGNEGKEATAEKAVEKGK